MTKRKQAQESAISLAGKKSEERRTVVVDGLALEHLGLDSLANVDLVLVADERFSQVGEHAHDEARVALRTKEEVEGVLEQRGIELMVRRSEVDVGELRVLKSGQGRRR